MSCSHAKINLKSATQKLNYKLKLSQTVIKITHWIVTVNALADSRHSNAALFSIKIILFETYNILFRKNY